MCTRHKNTRGCRYWSTTPDNTMTTESRARFEVRRSLPIVEDFHVDLTDAERKELTCIAARLVAEEPALSATGIFGPRVTTGVGHGPAALFEDHSETAFSGLHQDSLLEYRSIFLAQDGDLLLVGERRDPEFEDYCRTFLGLDDVDVDRPAEMLQGPALPLAARCASDPRIMERLATMARRSSELTLITYMGTGRVWQLAHKIADMSGAAIRVASPHPRLARRVNDKLWFAYRVNELLGRNAMPSTFTAFGPAALAGHLKRLARDHDRIVVKIPDSAGSEGNLVLRASDYEGLSLNKIKTRLTTIMTDLGWGATYPLVISVWESPLIDSPSVQVWVPHKEEGSPIIQGIFSQVVAGEAGEFVGAIPCNLPADFRYRMGREAVVLATLFQELGYFGPCSFDAVVMGSDIGSAQLHWIECNGRWTGVSIPLTLVNRLIGDWHDRPFVIVQRMELQSKRHASFADILRLLGPRLFNSHDASEGTIVLTPARTVEGTGVHLLVLAKSVALAQQEGDAVTALLLGDPCGEAKNSFSTDHMLNSKQFESRCRQQNQN